MANPLSFCSELIWYLWLIEGMLCNAPNVGGIHTRGALLPVTARGWPSLLLGESPLQNEEDERSHRLCW
jgi:hypothetical protein